MVCKMAPNLELDNEEVKESPVYPQGRNLAVTLVTTPAAAENTDLILYYSSAFKILLFIIYLTSHLRTYHN